MSKAIGDNSISNRLKLIRNELKLNQKEISDKLKITRAYWSALELGNRELTGNIIRALINEFDISADWLISGKKSMFLSDSDPNSIDFEKQSQNFYTQLVWLIELTEKLTGTNPDYDIYLEEIRLTILSIENTKNKLTKRLNFEKLSNALLADFLSLFDDYFKILNQSERTKKYNSHSFEPPRNFIKIELEK